MFKKVYKSKEEIDFRENAFKLTEVDGNRSFHGKKMHCSPDDIEDFIEEQDEFNGNFVQDDEFEEEEEFYASTSYVDDYEEDEDDFVQNNNSSYNDDNDSYQSFNSMDAASTDWGSVDFGSVDWGKF